MVNVIICIIMYMKYTEENYCFACQSFSFCGILPPGCAEKIAQAKPPEAQLKS